MTLSRKSRAALRLLALLASAPVIAQVLLAAPACAAENPAFQPARFSVEVRGQGPDVILIPGLASSRAVWTDTAARLEKTHRVHLVQVAGFAGQAPGPNAQGAVLAPLVEELHGYIAANHLKSPAVVGHSMGGLTGLLLAERHPEDVGRLMIVDAFPFMPAAFNPAATAASAETQAAALRDGVIAASPEAFAAQEQMALARMALTPAARKTTLEWALASDRSTIARAMYEAMTTDARPGLAALKTPVEVVYPYEASMGAPAAVVEAVYAGAYRDLPGVKLKRLDGGYHFIMLDQPAAFAAEVETFVK